MIAFGSLIDRLFDWMVEGSIDRMIDWLIDWLTYRLILIDLFVIAPKALAPTRYWEAEGKVEKNVGVYVEDQWATKIAERTSQKRNSDQPE